MTGTVREYLYAGGEAPTAMRARQSDGTFKQFFFVTNTHGDVVAVTDKDGVIVNRYAYGPWGEATRVSEQVHQPFRYAGYRYEDGFDLYYLRARWYDAGTGRFLSRDPARGPRRDLRDLVNNAYNYAANSPPSRIDPRGLSPRQPDRERRASEICRSRFGNSPWFRDFLAAATGRGGFSNLDFEFLTRSQLRARAGASGVRPRENQEVWAQSQDIGVLWSHPVIRIDDRLEQFGFCMLSRYSPLTTHGKNAPTPIWTLFHEAGHFYWGDTAAADPSSRQEMRADDFADSMLKLAISYILDEIPLECMRGVYPLRGSGASFC